MEVARIMRVAGYYNGDAMAYGRGMTAFKRSIDNLMGAI
jgi:hypothetical protein